MKSVNEKYTCFCWYLIFIVNHKSLGFLAENQVYIRFKAETEEQNEAGILHVLTENPITGEI